MYREQTEEPTWVAWSYSGSSTLNTVCTFLCYTSTLGACLQSYLTLCDPRDCSLPGSSVHGTFQARIVEWVAISSSKGSSWLSDWTLFSCSSCIGRWILNLPPLSHLRSPYIYPMIRQLFPQAFTHRNKNTCPQKELYKKVHSSFLYTCQKLQTTQMSINGQRINKHWYICARECYSEMFKTGIIY